MKEYLANVIDNHLPISIINKIEVLGFSHQSNLTLELLTFVRVIGLTDEIAEITVNIRKSTKIKLPDAIIAATAMANKLSLITRNVTDFKNVSDLVLINPWDR